MGRRTNAQIREDNEKTKVDAEAMLIRVVAKLMDEYGVPASANVLRVVADAIEAGTRKRVEDGDVLRTEV